MARRVSRTSNRRAEVRLASAGRFQGTARFLATRCALYGRSGKLARRCGLHGRSCAQACGAGILAAEQAPDLAGCSRQQVAGDGRRNRRIERCAGMLRVDARSAVRRQQLRLEGHDCPFDRCERRDR